MSTTRMIPREGIAHPSFEGTGPDDHFICTIGFAQPLDEPRMAAVSAELDTLAALPQADPEGGVFQVFSPFLSEHLLAFRIGNVAAPRDAVWNLLNRLYQQGVVFKDMFLSRWRFHPEHNAMAAVRDPRAPMERPGYPNPRMYLDDLWNPHVAMPPASEFPMELKGAFQAGNGNLVLEMRGMPLYFPGFRIGYGLHPSHFVEPDARTEQVRQAMTSALEVGWRDLFKAPGKEHLHPTPRDRDGNPASVERIVCGTRVGYTFAVECVQLLDWPCPGFCRFREYELFEAVLGAVAQLGLSPVVTWQRFGTPMMMGPLKKPEEVVIQVWENGGDHSGHPGLDSPAGHDDEDDDDEDYDEDDDFDDDDDEDDDD